MHARCQPRNTRKYVCMHRCGPIQHMWHTETDQPSHVMRDAMRKAVRPGSSGQAPVFLDADGAGFEGPAAAGALGAAAAALAAGVVVAAGAGGDTAAALSPPLPRCLVNDHLQAHNIVVRTARMKSTDAMADILLLAHNETEMWGAPNPTHDVGPPHLLRCLTRPRCQVYGGQAPVSRRGSTAPAACAAGRSSVYTRPGSMKVSNCTQHRAAANGSMLVHAAPVSVNRDGPNRDARWQGNRNPETWT